MSSLSLTFINSGAELNHLNVRRQGKVDERVTAVDIKVVGTVQATGGLLRAFFCPLDDNDTLAAGRLAAALWFDESEDPERPTRFLGVREVKSLVCFNACTLLFGGLKFIGDAKKFTLCPEGKMQATVSFVFSVIDPDPKSISILAEMIGEECRCEFTTNDLLTQDEDLLEPGDSIFDLGDEQQSTDLEQLQP